MTGPGVADSHRPGRCWRVVIPAVLSFAAWIAWLGWDHSYYYDAVVGAYQGPYRPWQAIGCVLTLLLASLIAGVLLRPVIAALWVTLPFALAWTIDAGVQDESGLFGVGAVMIGIGLYVGALLFSTLSHLTWRAITQRNEQPK